MSADFRAVQWNPAKIRYDLALLAFVAVYLGGYAAYSVATKPPEGILDRIEVVTLASGSCALFLMSALLAIGPLARLSEKFLPLLYNRRHLGVSVFLLALVHTISTNAWSYIEGGLPKAINEVLTLDNYELFIGFPYRTLGLAALLIMFVMAVTSHDLWLALLKPPVWKALHMLVYLAYGCTIMHVALGIMKWDRTPLIPAGLLASLAAVTSLHLLAGWKERHRDRGEPATGSDGWIAVAKPEEIPDKRARVVSAPGGERIAVFRDGTEIAALTNLCAHQNGPLGEGRIIDGCVTCPWHGFQYHLNGRAPPPFPDKISTYRVRLKNGVIELDPRPLEPGTEARLKT